MESSIDKIQIKKVERYRWIVWAIMALTYVFVTFHRMGTGVMKADLQKEFGINTSQFANIGSMYFYAYFIMQIPSGILADKLGPKKTATYFSILAAIGSLIFAYAPNITAIYIGRFLVGLGVSVIFVCIIKLQTKWFYTKNFALMIGMAGLAANLGAILAQTPLVIASKAFGWRKTFIIMGILMFVFAVLIYLFVKDDPKDMGLPSMDEIENRPIVKRKAISVLESLKSVLSNTRTWVITLAYLGLYTGYVVFLGQYGVSLLAIKYSLNLKESANYIIVAVVGSLVAGLVIGYISDKLKNRKVVLIVCSVITLVLWVLLVYVQIPKSILVPFLFLFGFFMSAFTLCWTVGNEVNDRRLSGIATGVINCIGFLAVAIVPVFMGVIIDNYKDNALLGYKKAYLILIILMVISVVGSLMSKETNAQNIYEEK